MGRFSVLGGLLLFLVAVPGGATTLAPGFVEDVVAAGFVLPTAFAFLPDGRVLVAEKSGAVRVVKNGGVLPLPFVNLGDHVNQYWDRGLTAMAVDPNFSANGRVYFFYPYEHNAADPTGPKTARLTRVTATGDVGGAETVLLGSLAGAGCPTIDARCIPQDLYGHSANALQFASDGTLFLSLGDAASWDFVDDRALRAQDVNQYPGKILRVGTDGRGRTDNPFYDGNPDSIRSRVWAYGLRNPFRFALRPENGHPYVGDVGWNAWEEINVATRGANLGWPCYEGSGAQSGYQSRAVCQSLYGQGTAKAPLLSWAHNGQSAAAIGGPFTPADSPYPAAYHGGFFYADYGQNWIRFAPVNANDALTGPTLTLASGANGPVALAFGPDGNLYYLAIAAGELRRVSYGGAPAGGDTYVSTLSPVSASNGWGPVERDQSNGELAAGDGGPLTIGGQTFARGLGVHAPSAVVYDLDGQCSRFTAQVGVDDEVGGFGSVVFQVWDGTSRKLYDSGIRRGTDGPLIASVDITGVQLLRLVVTDAGNGMDYDHADWADARISCGSSDTQPPTLTGISATATSSGATISWQSSEPADTQVEYGRTTAYGSLTPLAAALVTAHTQTVSGLTPGVLYHFRVRSRDAAGNLAVSGDATFTTASSSSAVFLSDLQPLGTPLNGWGPMERDRSNGEAGAGDGGPLTIGGQSFAKGLGVHAHSEISYGLGGSCSTFSAQIGIDDEVGSAGSVVFEVWNGTATRLYQSAVRRGTDGPLAVAVPVTGVTQLRLVVTGTGDGIDFDHADWADAKVACGALNAPPMPVIDDPPSTARFRVGDLVQVTGHATDPEDGTIASTGLSWTVTLFHCPGGDCHTHPFLQFSGAGGSFSFPDHGTDSWLRVQLTAVDSGGVAASVTRDLLPLTTLLTLSTSPPGLQLILDSGVVTTPLQVTAIVNSRHSIEAPSPQNGFTFTGWSDGGAQQHVIQVPAQGLSLTATFTTSTTGNSYVSDLQPAAPPVNGWGPIERDRSNGERAAGDGRPLTIGGQVFAKGLGVHAFSSVTYDLGGRCSRFTTQVGVDDEVGSRGSVVFEIWDGTSRRLFQSGIQRGTDGPLPVSVDLTGVAVLRLVVTDAGNGVGADHADWADAFVTCTAVR